MCFPIFKITVVSSLLCTHFYPREVSTKIDEIARKKLSKDKLVKTSDCVARSTILNDI